MVNDGGKSKTRSRSIPYRGVRTGTLATTVYRAGQVYDSTFNSADFNPPQFRGAQVTASESHPLWNHKAKYSFSGDIGGEFSTSKQYVDNVPTRRHAFRAIQLSPLFEVTYEFDGFCVPFGFIGASFPTVDPSPYWILDARGAEAIANCKPTNSVADLSTFLGETMRDGLPKLVGAQAWKSKTKSMLSKGKYNPKKAPGSEYLNYEFGWKPVVDDINSLAFAIANAQTVIEQYERDAGQVVRRRYEFPPVEQLTETSLGVGFKPNLIPAASAFYDGTAAQGEIILINHTIRRQWFSGAFTYHLPTGYNNQQEMQRLALEAKKLLGLSLTPEVLWNLAPWSWAVDWFSNAGDVVSNVSDWAVDGLVMKYGYMMEHVISKNTYAFKGPLGLIGVGQPDFFTLVTESKIRRKANPFGFGITWDGLTARQIAIAAALGINRS